VTDRIDLTGIQVRARHGALPEEKEKDQLFVVDVGIFIDTGPAAASDDLIDTVDYAALQTLVMTRVRDDSFHLIESLAASIGRAVLERWPAVAEVEVAVRKPEALLPGPAGGVEARIRLGRAR